MGIKVSIVFPVFNVDKYLKESLDSIFNQTYQNFEIIAVNDGSTDCSLEILEEYLNLGKMRIINQENQGLSAARNTGLKYVDGDIVYFMDSDDWILSDTLEKTVNIFENKNVDMVRFNAEPFSDDLGYKVDKNEYNFSRVLNEKTIYNKDEIFKKFLEFYIAPVWLYMVKSSVIKENKIIFKKGLLHEDELFTPILTSKCENIAYINENFFQRRYRIGSIMTTQKAHISIKNYNVIMAELFEYCKKNVVSKSTEEEFLLKIIRDLFYVSCSLDYEQFKREREIKEKYGVQLTIRQIIKLKIKKIRGRIIER